MQREIEQYVNKCLICQKVKVEHQHPIDELKPFIKFYLEVRLHITASKKNAIQAIVNELTKPTRFLPIRDTQDVDRLAQLYIREIVRLHGIPVDLVSDRDQRFQPQFWQALRKAFGTTLNFSITLVISKLMDRLNKSVKFQKTC